MADEDEPVSSELKPVGHELRIEDKLHTVKEVAVIFGVDPQTVRIWLRTGKMSSLKVGRAWRVSKQNMQEFAVTKYSG